MTTFRKHALDKDVIEVGIAARASAYAQAIADGKTADEAECIAKDAALAARIAAAKAKAKADD